MNPFSKIVGGIRAVYRKADNAISKERDEEIREMVKAGTLEAIETIGETMPEVAALLVGKTVELSINVQLRLQHVDEDKPNG